MNMIQRLNMINILYAILSCIAIFLIFILLKPRVESKIKDFISSESKSHPFLKKLTFESVSIDLLPPRLNINEVKLEINKYDHIKDIEIKKVQIYFNMNHLLSLEAKINKVIIHQVRAFFEKSQVPSSNIQFSYEDLELIPTPHIEIRDSFITYHDSHLNIENLYLKRYWNYFRFYGQNIKWTHNHKKFPSMKLTSLESEIRKDNFKLLKFDLRSKESYFQIGLNIPMTFNEKLLDMNVLYKSEFKLSSKIELERFSPFIKLIDKRNQINSLQGNLQVFANNAKKNNISFIEVSGEGEDINLNRYTINALEFNFLFKNDIVKFKNLRGRSQGLEFKSKNTQIKISSQHQAYTLKTDFHITHFEINDFLKNTLNMGSIPAKVPLHSQVSCQGNIYPTLSTKCLLKGKMKDLAVWSDSRRPQKSIIADLKPNHFEAELEIYSDHLNFKSSHKFKASQLTTFGTVNYIHGYIINYTCDSFDFSDFNSLVSIPLSGFGKVSGQSKGSSKWGQFNLDLSVKNFNFFNYNLGEFSSNIYYQEGILNFENTISQVQSSKIQAHVQYDVKSRIITLDASSDKISILDIQYIVKDISELPIYVSGNGSLKIELTGPLDLGQMTYSINGHFKEGIIYKDRYKDLKIQAISNDGHVQVQNSIFFLSDKVIFKGTVNPQGMVNVIGVGSSINLAHVKVLKDLGLKLGRIGRMEIQIEDRIFLPKIYGTFESKDFSNETSVIGRSKFNFAVHRDHSEFSGQFFDSSLIGNFSIPHNKKGLFFADLKVKDFDPLPLINIFGSKISQFGSNTQISGDVNLKAKNSLIKNLNGFIQLDSIETRSENHLLKLTQPSTIQIRNGHPKGHLSLRDSKKGILNIYFKNPINTLKGYGRLGYLGSILPGVEEVNGNIDIDTEFTIFPFLRFEGQGQVSNLNLRMNNLSHTFKDISFNLNFDKDKILLENIEGLFANGQVSASGFINYSENFLISIKGKARRLKLSIPEGVNSIVNGDFHFYGDQFPYTLGGNFLVLESLFEMKFKKDSKNESRILPSKYLPQMNQEVRSLKFDMNFQTKSPAQVITSFLEGLASVSVNVTGDPFYPILNGQVILIPSSKIFFQETNFIIKSGTIVFNKTIPKNAILNIDAQSRVTDYFDVLERQYDIRMLIQGTGSKPDISFSSQPLLDENKILSLLTLGVLDSNALNQELVIDNQSTEVGYQLGNFFLKNEFAQNIQNKLGVQLNFKTSYENQNVSPKIVVEKKFNSKFSLYGSRNLGTFQKNAARGEYKINKNLSIIGQYENYEFNNDTSLNRVRLVEGENIFGFDLQYNFEFK